MSGGPGIAAQEWRGWWTEATEGEPQKGHAGRPPRAAEYLRMSTEHQQYSTENQADAIRRYAEARGIEIVRTYTDHGKSGVTIHGRDGLQALLRVVESGQADFNTILVYDVSRWGRFLESVRPHRGSGRPFHPPPAPASRGHRARRGCRLA